MKAPELLPIDSEGVLCPLLVDDANDGGVEVFTTGSAGEEGVVPGERLEVIYVAIYSASTGYVGSPRLSGTGTFSASAIAAVSNVALGKRTAGSFARQRMMTMTSAGGTFGLMRTGEGGGVLRCCDITAVGLSPWKGSVPVTISYRIIPSE